MLEVLVLDERWSLKLGSGILFILADGFYKVKAVYMFLYSLGPLG